MAWLAIITDEKVRKHCGAITAKDGSAFARHDNVACGNGFVSVLENIGSIVFACNDARGETKAESTVFPLIPLSVILPMIHEEIG